MHKSLFLAENLLSSTLASFLLCLQIFHLRENVFPQHKLALWFYDFLVTSRLAVHESENPVWIDKIFFGQENLGKFSFKGKQRQLHRTIMHFNRLTSFSRNLVQAGEWSPRLSSIFSSNSNRSESAPKFHSSPSTSSQHVRKVRNHIETIVCRNFHSISSHLQMSSDALVSTLKNFSRRVKFYDRSEPDR